MWTEDESAVLRAVVNAVAKNPDFQAGVISATVVGAKEAIDAANARRAETERAYLMTLCAFTADRISPQLKSALLAAVLPALERYPLERECQAVRSAHKKITDALK